MKTVTFVPKALEGSEWSGSVTLRLPTLDEKFEYMEAMGVDVNDKGEVEMAKNQSMIARLRKMIAMTKGHYQELSLKHKTSGEEVKSFDDMQYHGDLMPVMMECATMLISGSRVGNV